MKHSDNHELDQMFKEAFDQAEMEPSVGVWRGIEREMDRKKSGNIILLIGKWSVAASVVLVVGVASYWFGFRNNDAASQLSSNTEKQVELPVESGQKNNSEKIMEGMQPTEEDTRLADVVEIKRKPAVNSKNTKTVKPKLVNETKMPAAQDKREEKQAIELLKTLELEAQENNKKPQVEPAPQRPVLTKPAEPSPSFAKQESTKKQLDGLGGIVTYLSQKVVGAPESSLVAVNETKKEDGSTRKETEVDLGLIKSKRVRSSY